MASASSRIYFVSLGCPKNQVDTELMLGQVQAAGHALVDQPEAADVIVVNTCAYIDAATEEDEAAGRPGRRHAGLHLRSPRAARADRRAPQRVRQDRGGLRPAMRV